MAALTDFHTTKPIKLLYIGDSGTGKTGSLASLAKSGYNLRILDFDNGLSSLAEVLRGDAEAMARVEYETCTDDRKSVKLGEIVKIVTSGAPRAFSNSLTLLDHWKGKNPDGTVKDLGPVSSWTSKEVLVIDSLTFMAKAAMTYTQFLAQRQGENPQIQDYGAVVRNLTDILQLICSDKIKCNVIVLSHIKYLGGDGDGQVLGFPSAIGKELPTQIASFFNFTFVGKVGLGKNPKRVISTVPDGVTAAKCPIKTLPTELPIETGLADFFKAYYKTN